MNEMRATHHDGRVRLDFEIPPGKLGLVYELLAEYRGLIVDRRKRRFTLEFQEPNDADEFLCGVFGRRVRLTDYLV
jgi:hypothetical protein